MADEEKTTNGEQHGGNQNREGQKGNDDRSWWPWALLIAAVLVGAGLLVRPMQLREPAPIRYTQPVPGSPAAPRDFRDTEPIRPDLVPLAGALDTLDEQIDRGDWDQADATADRINTSWLAMRDTLDDVDNDDANRFTQVLQRLRTAIDERDRGGAEQSIQELRDTLRGLTNVREPAR